jgi:hypothetical protein
MGNGGGLTLRTILLVLLIMVVVGGTVSWGGAKEGGWIGSGDVDDIERLSVLMRGDCTLALK